MVERRKCQCGVIFDVDDYECPECGVNFDCSEIFHVSYCETCDGLCTVEVSPEDEFPGFPDQPCPDCGGFGFDIAELSDEVRTLYYILDNPHPGLMTWRVALNNQMRKVQMLINLEE